MDRSANAPRLHSIEPEILPTVLERKFFVDVSNAATILDLLSRLLPRDPHYPFGAVHTVYFDRPATRSIDEPRRGFFRRGKLRLRWYGEPDLSPCFLEAKGREGALRRKVRLPVTIDPNEIATRPLSSPAIRRLSGLGPGLSPLVEAGTVPSLQVSYRRDRFVHLATGARVALDSDIECPAWNGCSLPGRPARFGHCVLEVKHQPGHFPRPLRILEDRLLPVGFSKYLYFRDRLLKPVLAWR